MGRLTTAQLRCLRFLADFPPDGTGRAEWRMEYNVRRFNDHGNDTDAAYRLRAETADRIVSRLVVSGLVDGETWALTPAGRDALAAGKEQNDG